MEAPTTTHPSAEALRAFALGKLDDAAAEVILRHIDSCAGCRREVAAQTNDDFLDQLRRAHGPGNTPAPAGSLAQAAAPHESRRTAPAAIRDLPAELAAHPEYDILSELGRGGMGVVYLARNRGMGRLEVLKVVNKDRLHRPGMLERFRREICAAGQLSHQNVVTAYRMLEAGDLVAFTMEYVEGQDLWKFVQGRLEKGQGLMPVAAACYYAQQVALGLAHAHKKGLVHRDIKPGNLILSRDGREHLVKILDFGLAKVIREQGEERELTAAGMMMGTPDYMAPEQALDAARADIRADIYSLGCTLYFLLTGQPPFRGKGAFDVIHAHKTKEPAALSLVRPDVPEGLAALVSKMLAKEPEERPQTPMEVAQGLLPFITGGKKAAVEERQVVPSDQRRCCRSSRAGRRRRSRRRPRRRAAAGRS